MSKSDSRFIFTLDSHIKQSRPAYTVPPVVVPKYVIDTNIGPYDCLEHYLFKTEPIRTEDYLLLSFIKPHKAVGTQTVGRWIKSILSGAGIDITAFNRIPPGMLPLRRPLTLMFRLTTFSSELEGAMLLPSETIIISV